MMCQHKGLSRVAHYTRLGPLKRAACARAARESKGDFHREDRLKSTLDWIHGRLHHTFRGGYFFHCCTREPGRTHGIGQFHFVLFAGRNRLPCPASRCFLHDSARVARGITDLLNGAPILRRRGTGTRRKAAPIATITRFVTTGLFILR